MSLLVGDEFVVLVAIGLDLDCSLADGPELGLFSCGSDSKSVPFVVFGVYGAPTVIVAVVVVFGVVV